MEAGGCQARSVVECGGKRSATPLSDATGPGEKLRRRCALPEHSKTWRRRLVYCCFLFSAFGFWASGQPYSIDWYKVSGGGGTSTGATYQATGTIGQPDASGAMSGGQYSVTGGFWSLIALVQTAGLPSLSIAHSGNSVVVSWSNTTSCTLQTNSNLAIVSGWNAYGGTVNTASGTNSISISPPTGMLFFRLTQP
jgi:hypothetical protein